VKRCRHPERLAATSWPLVEKYGLGDTWKVHAEVLICRGCGGLLSLGESSDTPEVLVEITLAGHLAEIHLLWEPGDEREHQIDNYVGVYAEHPGCQREAP